MSQKGLLGIICVGLFLSLTWITTAHLQDAPLLILTSPDAAHPVQFQLTASGMASPVGKFTSRLAVPMESDEASRSVYIAIQNTGWSRGVIGLMSDSLLPEARYVAVEVDSDRQPVPDGLVFELTYAEDQVGFVLSVLLGGAKTFAIYQADDSADTFSGYTLIEVSGRIRQSLVEHRRAAEPLFGRLVLDCHIRTLQPLLPSPTITPTAEAETGSVSAGDGSTAEEMSIGSPAPSATPVPECPPGWEGIPPHCISDGDA